jgi:hypothetical protein
MPGLYESMMATAQQPPSGLWDGLMQQASPAQSVPPAPIPQTLRNMPIQEWFESQANMRGPQDQAAANPGPFVSPEYIMEMRKKQEEFENNNLLRRLHAGKII